MYAAWKRRSLTILPEVNLVSNIGYGPEATHTKKLDPFANLATEPMEFPLRHPPEVKNLVEADEAFLQWRSGRGLRSRSRVRNSC